MGILSQFHNHWLNWGPQMVFLGRGPLGAKGSLLQGLRLRELEGKRVLRT